MRMLRTFSSSIFALLALAAATWLSPADAAGCSAGNGTCFVRSGGGNSTVNTVFSDSSNGGSCGCLPASTDTVILDSTSGQLTVNGALSIGSLLADGTGVGANGSYTGVLTQSTGIVITVNGASNGNGKFSLVPGMTYSPALNTSQVTFASTSGTITLTSGGKNFAGINVNGQGGTVLLGDNLSNTAVATTTINVIAGIFNAGSFGVTTGAFQSTGTAARSVILGGPVKIGGNVVTGTAVWNFTSTGITFTKNSANIEVVVPTIATVQNWTFVAGGMAYNSLVLDNNTLAGGTAISMTGNNTFIGNLTVGSGWMLLGPGGGSEVVTGNLAINGTAANPSGIMPFSASSQLTLAVGGTCTATYASIFAVTGTGSCGTYQAANSFNLTATGTGWNIKSPVVGIIGG